jgi:hypothetical protein
MKCTIFISNTELKPSAVTAGTTLAEPTFGGAFRYSETIRGQVRHFPEALIGRQWRRLLPHTSSTDEIPFQKLSQAPL